MSQLDNSVHISNLPFSSTRDDVMSFLGNQENARGIKIIHMPNHRFSENNRGYCNVELPSSEQTTSFIQSINDVDFNGRTLRAELMKPREQTETRNRQSSDNRRSSDDRSSNTSRSGDSRSGDNGSRSTYRSRPRRSNQYSAHFSNLNYNMTKAELIEYLRGGGDDTKGFYITRMPMHQSGRNKGFCDVSFPSEEQLLKVITDLDGCDVDDRRIRVTRSRVFTNNDRQGQSQSNRGPPRSNEASQPEASQPEASQPEASQPEVSQPEASQPEASEAEEPLQDEESNAE
jgi:RNA recognition motif-containing protein